MTQAGDRSGRFLANLLRVQPGEGRKTSLMFGLTMCAVGSFIIGRVARDSLFLSRYSIDTLPMLYIWVAVGVSLESILYSRIADRFRRDLLLAVTQIAAVVLYLAARLAIAWSGDWFYPVLYVMVELIGSLTIIQIWTLANDVFTTREAKRLFGIIGAGGVTASVVAGFSVRGVVRLIGTEQLLLLSALLLGCGLWIINRLSVTCREELVASRALVGRERHSRIALRSDWHRVFGNQHLLYVAALTVVLALVMTFVDYQFKLGARQAYLGREESLAGFFGLFWGTTGVLSLVVQFLVTGRMLEHLGVLASLLTLPLSMLFGAVAYLVLPGLWSATALKGGDAVLRYTINDATIQLLYLPVPAAIRARAKAFIDGIVRPLSIGLAGVSLAWLLPSIAPAALPGLVLALVVLWMVLTFRVRLGYLTCLVNSLRSRRLQATESSDLMSEGAAHQVLLRALEDPDEQDVLHALDLLPAASGTDWTEPLCHLVSHSSPRVRARALFLLGEWGDMHHGPIVQAALHDEKPEVQAAAVTAFCAIGRERAVIAISRLLDHHNLAIRSAAVVGLIRWSGLDGILRSADKLKAMVDSASAPERAAGAEILGRIGVKNFYHPLLPLMSDPDPNVRLAAIRAAGRMGSRELLPALIYRLDSPATRAAAADAIASYGPPAVRLLVKVMENPQEQRATRLAVPLILARIGDARARDALLARLPDTDEAVRSRVLEAVHRLRLWRPHLEMPATAIRPAITTELRQLYHLEFAIRDLQMARDSLLLDALSNRRLQAQRRLLRLFGCILPVRAMDAVLSNLGSSARRARANALEVLDNLLDGETKHLLLPLLEDSGENDLDETGREVFGLVHRPRREVLEELLHSDSGWLVCCALLEAVSGDSDPGWREAVLVSSSSEDPLVRETVLVVSRRLFDAQGLRRLAERHLRDPALQVRTLAGWLLEAGA